MKCFFFQCIHAKKQAKKGKKYKNSGIVSVFVSNSLTFYLRYCFLGNTVHICCIIISVLTFQVELMSCRVVKMHTFLDYIQGGLVNVLVKY